MDMRVANRLSGDFAAIYTNVEPRHQTVHWEYLFPSRVEQL